MSMKSVMKKASKYMLRSAHANKSKPCTPAKELKAKPEQAVDRNWRAARKVQDHNEIAVHLATSVKAFKLAMKHMAVSQKHLDKAQVALERRNCKRGYR